MTVLQHRNMNRMAGGGIWPLPIGESSAPPYPNGQSGCQDLVNAGGECVPTTE